MKSAFPGWSAVTMQVPGLKKDTMPPLNEQTVGVDVPIVATSPLDAVAFGAYVGPLTIAEDGAVEVNDTF